MSPTGTNLQPRPNPAPGLAQRIAADSWNHARHQLLAKRQRRAKRLRVIQLRPGSICVLQSFSFVLEKACLPLLRAFNKDEVMLKAISRSLTCSRQEVLIFLWLSCTCQALSVRATTAAAFCRILPSSTKDSHPLDGKAQALFMA